MWIATLHHFADDYDEYHEVAVKMLNFIREEQMQPFVAKFEGIFDKYQGTQRVCWPYGISVKKGKEALCS